MPTMPKTLHYKSADAVYKKLSAFIEAGPEKLHVVSDFDLTLTAGKNHGDNLGTWDVMDALMPPEGVAAHTAIYQSFRPIERAGKLTEAIAKEKWSDTLDLITGYRMSINDIEQAFLSVATLRSGAKNLFDICTAYTIPTVVLSSGIRNVIEIIAEHYDLRPDYILSNDLVVDESGHVSGWRRETLIHVLNKHEMGHNELSTLRTKHPHVLLLGDVPADTSMVPGDKDVIRVRILDPRRGETHHLDQALEESFAAGYDLVTEHSLEPITDLLLQLCKTSTQVPIGTPR